MKETELAKYFIDYFGDKFEIYKEVHANGIIDFIAKSGNILTAVEVKVNLNFRVIEQAFKNKLHCNYSYIAVPRPKNEHFGYRICQDFGIGILTYENNNWGSGIRESIAPKLNRKIYKPQLKEYMKRSVAGSQTDRVTAFQNTIENMTKYIHRHPECTLKNCLENIDFHWSSISSAKGCVYQWINQGIIKDFRLENGKLYLNE